MATIKSIEEKAKAYDKVLEWATEAHKVCGGMLKEDLEHLFPELKESEDERIRKAIIELVKQSSEILEKKNQEQMIAWLEKQGEQKQPKELTNSEFVEKCKGLSRLEQHILALVPTRPIDAIKVDARTIRYLVEQEQKPAWSEEDEAIYYGVIETEQYMLDVVNGIKKFNVGNISIKEECTRELNWLKSLKERVQPQPKQEWSEYDEYEIGNILSHLKACLNEYTYSRYEKYLKSLRPQNTWKPSDEQIRILELATENCAYSEYQDCLRELIEQLKKLKE